MHALCRACEASLCLSRAQVQLARFDGKLLKGCKCLCAGISGKLEFRKQLLQQLLRCWHVSEGTHVLQYPGSRKESEHGTFPIFERARPCAVATSLSLARYLARYQGKLNPAR